MKATLGLLALTLAAAAPLAPIASDLQPLALYEDHEPLHREGFHAALSLDQDEPPSDIDYARPLDLELPSTPQHVPSTQDQNQDREAWRPTGRIGAFLDALGVSPEIEWSHRPSAPAQAKSVVAVPAEGDLLRLGGRWYAVAAAPRFGLSPFGFRGKPAAPLPPNGKEEGVYTITAMGPSSLQRIGSAASWATEYLAQAARDARHALQDKTVYAMAMIFVAIINFASILIVLAYFRRESRQGHEAHAEEAREEAVTLADKV